MTFLFGHFTWFPDNWQSCFSLISHTHDKNWIWIPNALNLDFCLLWNSYGPILWWTHQRKKRGWWIRDLGLFTAANDSQMSRSAKRQGTRGKRERWSCCCSRLPHFSFQLSNKKIQLVKIKVTIKIRRKKLETGKKIQINRFKYEALCLKSFIDKFKSKDSSKNDGCYVWSFGATSWSTRSLRWSRNAATTIWVFNEAQVATSYRRRVKFWVQ